jgi:hypothetical protein
VKINNKDAFVNPKTLEKVEFEVRGAANGIITSI